MALRGIHVRTCRLGISFLRQSDATLFYKYRCFSSSESGKISVNGTNLFFEKHGDASRHVLCIPGALGTTQSDFGPQLKELSRLFTVIAFDPRGYGKSQPPKRDFPSRFYDRDAEDGIALMRKLGISGYSLLGWSDGGVVGLIIAGKETSSVQKLVVWGSNAFVSQEDIDCVERTRDLDKWSKKMRLPLEDVYGKDGLRHVWNAWMDAFIKYKDNEGGSICVDSLPNISCPTLILHGAKDPMLPGFHPYFLKDRIKNSRLHIMLEGKHNIHLRYFEEFNRLVTDFLLS